LVETFFFLPWKLKSLVAAFGLGIVELAMTHANYSLADTCGDRVNGWHIGTAYKASDGIV
jgi:hypothetical protein